MLRNNNVHFSQMPEIETKRSTFNRPCDHKLTYNTGEIVPIYLDQDIMPGDTVKINMMSLTRMSTPIYPVMDNAEMSTYFFFIPTRLLWSHWREFWGENTQGHWVNPVEYTIPQIAAPTGGWTKGTIADHMGLPINVDGIKVSALPFRAYAMVYNEWFRAEAVSDPALIDLGDSDQTGSNGSNYVNDAQLGGMPCHAAKHFDYFTSCLPSAQAGPAVNIPLGDVAPVVGNGNALGWDYKNSYTDVDNVYTQVASNQLAPMSTQSNDIPKSGLRTPASHITGQPAGGTWLGVSQDPLRSGLLADLSAATGSTVNQLRQAFAVQKYYELIALSGQRYREQIRAMFGVQSLDARMQIPEYLGGTHTSINITQVLQTSSTDSTSPQGNTAAYSLTTDGGNVITYSATEHGIILGVAVIRHDLSYQQGIERGWTRKTKLDYYQPVFANLGNMPVYNKEIYATGTAADDEVFGWQEAYADLRYKPSFVSGAFRSAYAQSLDAWHYADYYSQQPILGDAWMQQGATNVDRTLAVQSQLEDQWISDFYFSSTYTRVMPLYSVPGLIDHF